MKFTMEKITEGEDEVILRYCQMTSEVERIWNFLHGTQGKLTGWKGKTRVVLEGGYFIRRYEDDGRDPKVCT